jgi:hypothetical protein
MNPQDKQQPGQPGGEPKQSPRGDDARTGSGKNRKDAPRYDDRPPRPAGGGNPSQEQPTPGETPQRTSPIDPTTNTPDPTTGPRYGDRESDDPRRGTVEAGEDVEDSDKSGR